MHSLLLLHITHGHVCTCTMCTHMYSYMHACTHLWRDKVLCNLDATAQISHLQNATTCMSRPAGQSRQRAHADLVRCPSRDEDCIPHTLGNSPALHTTLSVQALAEVRVQVDQLVMNGVGACLVTQTSLLIDLQAGGKKTSEREKGGREGLGGRGGREGERCAAPHLPEKGPYLVSI